MAMDRLVHSIQVARGTESDLSLLLRALILSRVSKSGETMRTCSVEKRAITRNQDRHAVKALQQKNISGIVRPLELRFQIGCSCLG